MYPWTDQDLKRNISRDSPLPCFSPDPRDHHLSLSHLCISCHSRPWVLQQPSNCFLCFCFCRASGSSPVRTCHAMSPSGQCLWWLPILVNNPSSGCKAMCPSPAAFTSTIFLLPLQPWWCSIKSSRLLSQSLAPPSAWMCFPHLSAWLAPRMVPGTKQVCREPVLTEWIPTSF